MDQDTHEDRFIPIDPSTELLDELRKLKIQTMQDGGPFVEYRDKSNTNKKWHAIVKQAEIPPITVHDLRRTGITRALLAGMPSVLVQRMAGHKNIKTTMEYYTEVTKQDLRDGVARLTAAG